MTTYSINVAADTPLVNAAETVVATLAGVSMNRLGQRVDLRGTISVNGGTSTTAYVLRIREDSLAGALVDEAVTDTLTSAVGSDEDHEITATHAPTVELAGKTYVLTVVQTGGAANGTVKHATLVADTLP